MHDKTRPIDPFGISTYVRIVIRYLLVFVRVTWQMIAEVFAVVPGGLTSTRSLASSPQLDASTENSCVLALLTASSSSTLLFNRSSSSKSSRSFPSLITELASSLAFYDCFSFISLSCHYFGYWAGRPHHFSARWTITLRLMFRQNRTVMQLNSVALSVIFGLLWRVELHAIDRFAPSVKAATH